MRDIILGYEPIIRVAAFAGVFAAVAFLEAAFPRRAPSVSRWIRWPNNLGIAFLNTALIRVLFPTAAVGVALFAEARDAGLLRWLDLPEAVAVAIAVLVLDLAIYLQHVVWRSFASRRGVWLRPPRLIQGPARGRARSRLKKLWRARSTPRRR